MGSGLHNTRLVTCLACRFIDAAGPIIDRLKVNGALSSGGSFTPLSSAIAHAALQSGALERHMDTAVRPGLAARAAALCEALQQHMPYAEWDQPQGGYFVWLKLPAQARGNICTLHTMGAECAC